MTLDIWIYYTIAILILTASPGPSSLLCMTRGGSFGLSTGVYTALGSVTAIWGILTLSFIGLGVIVTSSEWLFSLIKWFGAAYLIYLGFNSLIRKQESYQYNQENHLSIQSVSKSYFSGFIVGISNPKAIVFFTALFPQFIDVSSSLITQYLIFSITFLVLEFAWLCFYSYLGAKSSLWIHQKGRAKTFNQLTGSVFIGAGLLLSTVSRS